MTPFTTDLPTLVALASAALLAQEPVRMVLPADWARPHDFPLPVKREPAGEPQSYRPLAIMEWVDAELRGENKAQEMRVRRAAAATGDAS